MVGRGEAIASQEPSSLTVVRTIFFDRCFNRSFVCPVVCISIFVKPYIIPPVGSGSRHLVSLLIGDDLCLVNIRVRTRGGSSIDRQDEPVHALDHLLGLEAPRCGKWVAPFIGPHNFLFLSRLR